MRKIISLIILVTFLFTNTVYPSSTLRLPVGNIEAGRAQNVTFEVFLSLTESKLTQDTAKAYLAGRRRKRGNVLILKHATEEGKTTIEFEVKSASEIPEQAITGSDVLADNWYDVYKLKPGEGIDEYPQFRYVLVTSPLGMGGRTRRAKAKEELSGPALVAVHNLLNVIYGKEDHDESEFSGENWDDELYLRNISAYTALAALFISLSEKDKRHVMNSFNSLGGNHPDYQLQIYFLLVLSELGYHLVNDFGSATSKWQQKLVGILQDTADNARHHLPRKIAVDALRELRLDMAGMLPQKDSQIVSITEAMDKDYFRIKSDISGVTTPEEIKNMIKSMGYKAEENKEIGTHMVYGDVTARILAEIFTAGYGTSEQRNAVKEIIAEMEEKTSLGGQIDTEMVSKPITEVGDLMVIQPDRKVTKELESKTYLAYTLGRIYAEIIKRNLPIETKIFSLLNSPLDGMDSKDAPVAAGDRRAESNIEPEIESPGELIVADYTALQAKKNEEELKQTIESRKSIERLKSKIEVALNEREMHHKEHKKRAVIGIYPPSVYSRQLDWHYDQDHLGPIANICSELAFEYAKAGLREEALQYMKQATDLHEELHENVTEFYVGSWYDIYIKPVELYIALGDYPSAKLALREAKGGITRIRVEDTDHYVEDEETRAEEKSAMDTVNSLRRKIIEQVRKAKKKERLREINLFTLKVTPVLFLDTEIVENKDGFKEALKQLRQNEGNIPVILLTKETEQSIRKILEAEAIDLKGVQFRTLTELGLKDFKLTEAMSLIDGIEGLQCIPLTEELCKTYKELQKVRDEV